VPQVSIIIPAYNAGRFLREALESVIAQTFHEWEAIIIDDGSAEDLSWVPGMDRRFQLICQENRGLSAARNFGIMQSAGSSVAFIDADDVWLPDKLERQMAQLEDRPEAVLCHTQMRFVNADGERGDTGWGGGYETYDDLLDGCGVCISSVLIRREALFRCGLFDPLLKTAQDYDLWLKATRHGPMIAIRDALTLYRLHGTNMSSDYMRTHREVCGILLRHMELARREGNRSRVAGCRRGIHRTRRSTALQAWNAAAMSIRTGRLARAAAHIVAGLQISPSAVVGRLYGTAGQYIRSQA
jgi:glycosyltransferase involved in cell wall biosynthesis